jgi:hypothetical protein
MGDSTIVDMMSYMRALSAFQKGDSTSLAFERAGAKLEAKVKF